MCQLTLLRRECGRLKQEGKMQWPLHLSANGCAVKSVGRIGSYGAGRRGQRASRMSGAEGAGRRWRGSARVKLEAAGSWTRGVCGSAAGGRWFFGLWTAELRWTGRGGGAGVRAGARRWTVASRAAVAYALRGVRHWGCGETDMCSSAILMLNKYMSCRIDEYLFDKLTG